MHYGLITGTRKIQNQSIYKLQNKKNSLDNQSMEVERINTSTNLLAPNEKPLSIMN